MLPIHFPNRIREFEKTVREEFDAIEPGLEVTLEKSMPMGTIQEK
jgi:hypothetical protein